MTVGRRELLKMGLATACALIGSPALAAIPAGHKTPQSKLGKVGPLLPADANGVLLPEGFKSRIVAYSGRTPVKSGAYAWHGAPDGGATYTTADGGWIYVSNSEMPNNQGGAGALRFTSSGEVVDAYRILGNTNINCAGGPTPWGTWLSCEEYPAGMVWECDPSGKTAARSWPALGVFAHEAVAVDPVRMQLYLTEDMPDGRWYRFTPDKRAAGGNPDLSAGALEVAEILGEREGKVRWHRLPDPQGKQTPTRKQVTASTPFAGGEGCWHANGIIYFTTKRDNRVWAYHIEESRIEVLYDASRYTKAVLTGVDNVTVSSGADVIVAEDGGDMQIVALTPGKKVVPIMQLAGHARSEITGPAFDPSGTRLYFSSQRGTAGRSESGITFEISGPFNG